MEFCFHDPQQLQAIVQSMLIDDESKRKETNATLRLSSKGIEWTAMDAPHTVISRGKLEADKWSKESGFFRFHEGNPQLTFKVDHWLRVLKKAAVRQDKVTCKVEDAALVTYIDRLSVQSQEDGKEEKKTEKKAKKEKKLPVMSKALQSTLATYFTEEEWKEVLSKVQQGGDNNKKRSSSSSSASDRPSKRARKNDDKRERYQIKLLDETEEDGLVLPDDILDGCSWWKMPSEEWDSLLTAYQRFNQDDGSGKLRIELEKTKVTFHITDLMLVKGSTSYSLDCLPSKVIHDSMISCVLSMKHLNRLSKHNVRLAEDVTFYLTDNQPLIIRYDLPMGFVDFLFAPISLSADEVPEVDVPNSTS